MINFNERCNYAASYLRNLNSISNTCWQSQYKQLDKLSGYDQILHKLSLINPAVFKLINGNLNGIQSSKIQERIQGSRTFKTKPITGKCESHRLWGYECPFDSPILVYDHDFPYSLGGPTNDAYNKRVLCKWHNMFKNNDIHNFDWTKLFFDFEHFKSTSRHHWIDEQLEKIKNEFNV